MLLRHATRQTARTFSSTAIPATSVATLHELGVAAGDVYGDQKSLGAKDASSGEWTWTSYAERNERAQNLGRALAKKSIGRPQRIGLSSHWWSLLLPSLKDRKILLTPMLPRGLLKKD